MASKKQMRIAAHLDDEIVLKQKTGIVSDSADFSEPFERIREALKETVQSGATL